MTRKILVPLDGSRFGEHSLPRALVMARRLGAALELVTVASPAAPSEVGTDEVIVGEDARDEGMARAEAYLENVEERLRAAGFEGEVSRSVVPPGNVAASLVRHLHAEGGDLTVMTTHGRGALQRAWLGSVADGFIRRSPGPVFLIRPGADEGDGPIALDALPEPPRRILAPLDGSEAAEMGLKMAATLAPPGARFVLLRVVPPFFPGGSPYLPHVVREEQDQELLREKAQEYLDGVARRMRGEGADVETKVVTATQPGSAIVGAAEEEQADLIAMSTHGRGGVGRLLLGSAADKVVRGAPCPVLIYRGHEVEG